MADKNNAGIETNENNYLKAARLADAMKCLLRNEDKADMYEEIAQIYKSLDDYKDSAKLYTEYTKKADEYKKLVESEKKEKAEANKTSAKENTQAPKKIIHKSGRIIGLLILFFAVGGIIFLKTEPGRYARASFYEKIGNYQKSYKMFGNLKTYKDSESRSDECRYEYANECLTKKQYETAQKAYRPLGNYKDSEKNLAFAEIEIIKNTKVGGNILFGEYRWLIAEKKDDKVLLVKSQPINGFAYNETAEDVTWESCSLRSYLNNGFLHEVFNSSMTELILDTEVTIPDNTKYETIGGNTTVDKIFLLSAEQFHQYSDTLSNYLRDCWLINPGNSQSAAQFVSYGEVMDYGYNVTNTNIHIRPALWVTIE